VCGKLQARAAFEITVAPHLAGVRAGAASSAHCSNSRTKIVFRGRKCATSWLVFASPENAVVLVVDEKSQIQALERTQPMLPIGWATSKGVTHELLAGMGPRPCLPRCIRPGATCSRRCRQRHRHQEYLDFLRQIDQNVPPDLEVHVIVDNYATHKHRA